VIAMELGPDDPGTAMARRFCEIIRHAAFVKTADMIRINSHPATGA